MAFKSSTELNKKLPTLKEFVKTNSEYSGIYTITFIWLTSKYPGVQLETTSFRYCLGDESFRDYVKNWLANQNTDNPFVASYIELTKASTVSTSLIFDEFLVEHPQTTIVTVDTFTDDYAKFKRPNELGGIWPGKLKKVLKDQMTGKTS